MPFVPPGGASSGTTGVGLNTLDSWTWDPDINLSSEENEEAGTASDWLETRSGVMDGEEAEFSVFSLVCIEVSRGTEEFIVLSVKDARAISSPNECETVLSNNESGNVVLPGESAFVLSAEESGPVPLGFMLGINSTSGDPEDVESVAVDPRDMESVAGIVSTLAFEDINSIDLV